MVVVAETGHLPALCGQELPLALWVDVPSVPPCLEMKHGPWLCSLQGAGGVAVLLAAPGASGQGWRSAGVRGSSGWCQQLN